MLHVSRHSLFRTASLSPCKSASRTLVSFKPRHLSTLTTLRLSDEVRSALDEKRPLVALESTIISHGMPYPQNYETAVEVEKIIRDNGATPATIAIMDGQINIGLSDKQINQLAKLGREAVKTSRRDLAVVMAKKQTGATTVSATMLLAHRAGISIFATGGIGGVHRGYENTLDASADLTELGRTPVAVVCAGVKSILDIGKTLEFLETEGVTVATFGPTTDFPAFFTRTSGFHSMVNVESPKEAAAMIAANHAVNLHSGIVFGVPIAEADAMDERLVGEAIDLAVKESLIAKSLSELVCKIMHSRKLPNCSFMQLTSSFMFQTSRRSYSSSARQLNKHQIDQGPIMVIGGIVVDITSTANTATSNSMLHSSYPGATRITAGGVGRNVAEAVTMLCPDTCVFVSAIGGDQGAGSSEDVFGPWLVGHIARKGMGHQAIFPIPGFRTATYTALHDASGSLLSAVADMDVFERLPIDKMKETIAQYRPRTICFDANLSAACMKGILETCRDLNVITFFEPTSEAKCARALDGSMLTLLNEGLLNFASPNEYELRTMAIQARKLAAVQQEGTSLVQRHAITAAANTDAVMTMTKDATLDYEELLSDAAAITQFIPTLFIKLGSKGVLVCQRTLPDDSDHLPRQDTLTWRWFKAHKVNEIKSVTGAGDSFVASIVTSLHSMKASAPDTSSSACTRVTSTQFWKHLDQLILDAQTAATLTLETHETVSPALVHTQQAKTMRLIKQ
ncbi:hypothetical protein BGZ68_001714 [Mortierella alpina]|nr:hypothetical protein BGZ68_001714 [Mortierella alpina]